METVSTSIQPPSLGLWVSEWLASANKDPDGDDAMKMLVYIGILGIIDYILQVVFGITLAKVVQELIAIFLDASSP